jgi:hypothetical protein
LEDSEKNALYGSNPWGSLLFWNVTPQVSRLLHLTGGLDRSFSGILVPHTEHFHTYTIVFTASGFFLVLSLVILRSMILHDRQSETVLSMFNNLLPGITVNAYPLSGCFLAHSSQSVVARSCRKSRLLASLDWFRYHAWRNSIFVSQSFSGMPRGGLKGSCKPSCNSLCFSRRPLHTLKQNW